MSIDALHALTLNSKNAESSVTVNQRALIDKVLSRYSSENTLLRELLQNSDDANATCVKIIYESATDQARDGVDIQDIHKRLTKRVVVKNNGHLFRPEDWTRLSRIAEGNPDETKIGAFGVGFYSVFSICEDPFVTSGQTGLAFYWRNDQLFTRTASLPTKDEWTTFALNMRQDNEIPNLKSLTKFLATSLTFSRSLAQIELWLDDQNLCNVQRIASPETPVSIPRGLATTASGRMLKITGASISSVQISASYLDITQTGTSVAPTQSRFLSFFTGNRQTETKVSDSQARTSSTIFLRVLTGSLTSSVAPAFAAELQRATKKPPPKNTKLQLVTVNAKELAASTHKVPIFENLMSFPDQGRVYIGFPTHQTTGFAGHVGAPCVIPTVERESIDLVDRYIKVWNFEVLRAIGLLARIAYHTEFLEMKTVEEAVHTIKFFGMRVATPQNINQSIEQAFFESSSVLPVFSTHGVQSSVAVRLPDPDIRFLQRTPILAEGLAQQTPEFIERLTRLSYIESISIGDIRKDLQDRTLSLSEAALFLKYSAKLASNIDAPALASLLSIAVVTQGTESAPIHLGGITHHAQLKNIPDGIPLPRTCLPSVLTSQLSANDLRLLGWPELLISSWLKFITTGIPGPDNRKYVNRLTTEPEFAISILSIVSKNFDVLTTDDRSEIIAMLREVPCIPTKNHGMQRPDQTYFHTIKMFDDLPLILSMKGVKERFLSAIGVRKTIELTIIFDRLVSGGRWSTYDVINYLASVRKDIPARDLERLKATPLAGSEQNNNRQLISQLYEPNETLRLLNLPIISWPKDKWKPHSDECNLLFTLGLRRIPPLQDLLTIASLSDDVAVRERALSYFTINFTINNYGADYVAQNTTHVFVPCESGRLSRPRDVYIDSASAIFGFDVLRKDLVHKASVLGVKAQPPVEKMISLLVQKPPTKYSLAVAQFSLIARMQPSLSKGDIDNLSQRELLPIEKNCKFIKMCQPRKCFFKQANVDSLYHEIFDFVDYGPAGNQFLRSIGVRDEPSTSQIAGMLVNDASNVWSICGSEVKYSGLLSQIARDAVAVKKDRHLWEAMKRTKFLLSYKYTSAQKSSTEQQKSTDFEDDDMIMQTSLQKASNIVIVDDFIDFNMFRTHVHSCPQDQYLEDLYRELGSSRISSMILDRPIVNGTPITNEFTTALRIEALERLNVFLSESNTKPKRDIEDLTRNLTVKQQDKIAIQRDLRSGDVQVSKHQTVSALTIHEGRKITLVVTKSPSKYDIAVALCKVVLSSAKTGDYLLLETLLINTLRTLKVRGYNVDRILQRQEREKRQRHLEREQEERQATIDAEEAHKANLLKQTQSRSSGPRSVEASTSTDQDGASPMSIPGEFPQTSRSSGFLFNIKKGFGINKPEQRQFVHNPQIGASTQDSAVAVSETPQAVQARPRPDQAVTSQNAINQALQRAVRMTRSSDDKSVFSAGVVNQVSEAKSFCDPKPAQDLVLAATLGNGIKFFINRHLDQGTVLMQHTASAQQFSQLLSRLGQVFNSNAGSLNICYDDAGPTIAFNKTGTIYCNLRFYNQLHSQLPDELQGEAVTYWFVTLAHELAHNLVSEHSSEHEFYMESMIVQYMPRLLPLLARKTGSQAGPPQYQA
ncbi:protein of unknown function [Taphrina deformans PYCC 5710]|uniref:Sacsin/Nov domain-containing protein n=1 Tax=Taphrina deformans (strain PYCC 5710 / ATCC 11124 / CBS 356.35 / IMI 108563 / JCM 9778 / NBRC 8474) TaxID=1097556 RepID=R4XHM1_TAPDE|nr:protein of unknown function [Taphrina deformans PYCC 5710]|eukprot:CCG84023.1 protein of unknown function [Taphrina deformans PYCC 5710]